MSKAYKDKILLAASIAGDEESFGKLYDSYINDIYRFIVMRVRTAEEAQDLCSEVFLKTWQYVSEGSRDIENFRALIYRIARNLVIDYYRKLGRELSPLDDEQFEHVPDPSVDLEKEAELRDDMRIVFKHLETLPDEQQELIVLRYTQDLSIREISAITGKSSGAVRVALHRAMKQLKQSIKE